MSHQRNISQNAYERMSAEERELWELREAAARANERREETMTRGDILDAIEMSEYEFGDDAAAMRVLNLLKRVFE